MDSPSGRSENQNKVSFPLFSLFLSLSLDAKRRLSEPPLLPLTLVTLPLPLPPLYDAQEQTRGKLSAGARCRPLMPLRLHAPISLRLRCFCCAWI